MPGIILKIKKPLFLIVAMLSAAFGANAKEMPDTISARRAFIEIPATTLDLLSRSTRLDMLDFYDADSILTAVNERDGISKLDKVTPDYLSLDITSVSDIQFKILKDKKGNDILMTIYTVGESEGVRDSEISFFDASLNPLDAGKYITLPLLKDFVEIPKGSLTKLKEIEEMVPFYNIEYFASPGSDELIAEISVEDAMTLEDYKLVSLFLKPRITMVWDGKKFKKQ